MKDMIALYTAIVLLISNLIVMITQFVKLAKIKKDIDNKSVIINNNTDLKKALNKPLEGKWEVKGDFPQYHGVNASHISSGFAFFIWDDYNNRYDVFYAYSTQKENDNADLVTALCQGEALCNMNGDVEKKDSLKLHMKINNRTSSNKSKSSSKNFDLISKNIVKSNGKIIEIEFAFDANSNSHGIIKFRR